MPNQLGAGDAGRRLLFFVSQGSGAPDPECYPLHRRDNWVT